MAMKGNGRYRRNALLAVVFGVILILGICGNGWKRAEGKRPEGGGISKENTGNYGRSAGIAGESAGTTGESAGTTGESAGIHEENAGINKEVSGTTGESIREVCEGGEKAEEAREEAIRLAEGIDFSVRESPIDFNRYDKGMDSLYKEAFLKAVTNQVPIQCPGSADPIYYQDLLPEGGKMSDKEFWQAVRESDYFYQDFDGDGLPELTVNTEGSCVLKYLPESGQVKLCRQKEPGWNLLGRGQMLFRGEGWEEDGYYHYRYGYEALDLRPDEYGDNVLEQGIFRQENEVLDGDGGLTEVFFQDMLAMEPGGWEETYQMAVRTDRKQYKDVPLQREQAGELQKGYWDARDNAPHPMSFSVFFGEDGQPGFWVGDEAQPRYWPEKTDPLPVNQEEGEEWEAYREMLEGDFSLVDSDRWGSLQWDYEEALEEGGGKCNWEYFLMDFNQDGSKEMVIRMYPDGVNNTAFFRYEDGRVKMWGSYHSADAHGYMVPLANGKILSVYWYQDDRTWWIERLNFQGYCKKERSYSTGRRRDEPEHQEEALDSGSLSDEEGEWYCSFQDYYADGRACGQEIFLSEEEWGQIEKVIEGLYIPESTWKPCSVFTPKAKRPDIPSVG